MINESHEFDYTIRRKPEGKYLLCRILMIFGYVIFGATYFFGLAALHLYPLMAFIVLLEWIVVFFTWRFVSIEYKYETVSGGIRFYKVSGGKKKKLILEKRIKEFENITPYDDEAKAVLANEIFSEKHFLTRSLKDNADCFYAIYEAEGGKGLIVFEATQSALKTFRFYNSNTVIADTRY